MRRPRTAAPAPQPWPVRAVWPPSARTVHILARPWLPCFRAARRTRWRLHPLAALASLAPRPASPASSSGERRLAQRRQDLDALHPDRARSALVIFIGVEGLLIYSMFKFRARKGAIAAQIHGNTRLEIGWTVGAAVILIFITVFTFVMLGGITHPAPPDRRQRQPGRPPRTLPLRLDRPAAAAQGQRR